MQPSLVTAHSFMLGCAVAKWTRKALSWGFCEGAYRPVGPKRRVFVIQLSPGVVVKILVLRKRPQAESGGSDFPVRTR
jgi:hypothetical protein